MDGEARGERKLQGEKRKENYAAKRAEFLHRPTHQGLLEMRLLFLQVIAFHLTHCYLWSIVQPLVQPPS